MDNEMRAELQRLENKIEEMDNKFKAANHKLDQVLIVLVGNVLDKNDSGFIGTVTALEKRVLFLEKWKDRVFWVLIGMALPAGVGVWELLAAITGRK